MERHDIVFFNEGDFGEGVVRDSSGWDEFKWTISMCSSLTTVSTETEQIANQVRCG